MEKAWAPLVGVAMFLSFATIVVLLLTDTSAPASATPPAAEPPHQQADGRAPPDPAAPYQDPDDPTAGRTSASETSPAPQPGVPPDSEASTPTAREQRILKSRRALETVDPRELLRQATIPK